MFFSVGLTGGVGSGKSTIAGMFLRHGAGIVDADALAHELTQSNGAAIGPIRRAFGADAIAADGSLDRAWMRGRAFGDPDARRMLESVLHPIIRNAALARARALAANGSPYIVFVIPLLVEAGNWHERYDRVLVIDCTEATQVARVSSREGIDEQMARAILAAQASREQRLTAADDILFNEAPLDEISAKVERLHVRYAELAHARATEAL